MKLEEAVKKTTQIQLCFNDLTLQNYLKLQFDCSLVFGSEVSLNHRKPHMKKVVHSLVALYYKLHIVLMQSAVV